jgi:hypothetical protein
VNEEYCIESTIVFWYESLIDNSVVEYCIESTIVLCYDATRACTLLLLVALLLLILEVIMTT